MGAARSGPEALSLPLWHVLVWFLEQKFLPPYSYFLEYNIDIRHFDSSASFMVGPSLA